ncbi:MAG: hypothetical protein EA421_05965 [Gemmatimonadales bacterium]|jgi:hypothetical protein|nr:MAG: hypothetical protein EA421_05965 [Gemmatimonadales bacterium]
MDPDVADLFRQALRLKERDRASLAGALLETLYGPEADQGGDWEEVILRRVRELEETSIDTVPWSEVRERLFRGYT